MPPDDMPSAEPLAPADAIDAAFQAGFSAGSDGFRVVDAAMGVLTARIERGKDGGAEDAAIRDMRCAAANRILRVFAADIDPAG